MMAIRRAQPGDDEPILDFLKEVASEVPVLVEPEARWALLVDQVTKACAVGLSRVALDAAGSVIGFLLVEPDERERFQLENGALHLAYAGVTRASRGHGALRALVRDVMDEGAPLTATVKTANASEMLGRLQRFGFRILVERSDEMGLRRSREQ
jgi:ribosomal protein S18 acetylase RimI-like enzyme